MEEQKTIQQTEQHDSQTSATEQKLNRKQRRALNSKRGGESKSTNGSDRIHENRVEPKPKARRR